MYRSIVLVALVGFIFLISCEKCKKCSYSYTVTEIIQTVNGEEEVTTTYNDVLANSDTSLADKTFDSECIKGDDVFTIEQAYINYGLDHPELDNYTYTCTDL